uniref:Vav guanine nucleotide exchange factor 3 n=1 Tax=Callithrix jacchus TaxID=9483 RepID=A0A8I3WVU8_CALJA|nr:guanine nucleotide exchange factor VAV3 isoform X2 [Callithrix jacchus]
MSICCLGGPGRAPSITLFSYTPRKAGNPPREKTPGRRGLREPRESAGWGAGSPLWPPPPPPAPPPRPALGHRPQPRPPARSHPRLWGLADGSETGRRAGHAQWRARRWSRKPVRGRRRQAGRGARRARGTRCSCGPVAAHPGRDRSRAQRCTRDPPAAAPAPWIPRGEGAGGGWRRRGAEEPRRPHPPRPPRPGSVPEPSGMEPWKQCAQWLIHCKVLPANHRVTWDSAQVFDLAQTLRDGVLLCQLLNNLRAHSINLKEINLRPQMSQVIETLSRLSRTPIALATGIRPFPTEESINDEDIYKGLPDLIDETLVEDEEDLYDCVYGEDEGGEVYEDLMKAEEAHQPKCPENDIRTCCLAEIKQTEEKYTETLESIEKYFMAPLKRFLTAAEFDSVFINIPELVKLHRNLMQEIHDSIVNKNDQNLYQVFINYKERLVIYGQYCSGVESAISSLDYISKTKEDVKLKLEECSKRANNGKFTLRDLLVVPMQRVLKYHLLLQELVKHTTDPTEKANLKLALDAMKDLAQYVNEVKRDNETLREIKQFQLSIENLNQPVLLFGRPQGDGEIRITTLDKHTKQERHIFLFDLAVIVCKRKGDNYEMKEIIDLQQYKIANNPTTDKENKKWSYGFYLIHTQGQNGLEFYCKTKDLKKKWLEQFEMALSNIRPDYADSNFHDFKMHTFTRVTSCKVCQMLLRGTFYQGYLCFKCGARAHKECLGRVDNCGRVNSGEQGTLKLPEKRTNGLRRTPKQVDPGLPKMQVIRNYSGTPPPALHEGPPLHLQAGDTVELLRGDAHSLFWQGRNLASGEVGFFPSDAVKPCPCVPKPVDYSCQPWYAGAMERLQAETELINRVNSTYLVRHRTKESGEYAISIKYNNEAKHIKILTRDGFFHIAENRKFKSLMELVEYYKHHSLKEGFRTLDTTLQFPYKEPEHSAGQRGNRPGNSYMLLSSKNNICQALLPRETGLDRNGISITSKRPWRIQSKQAPSLFCGFSFVTPPGYSFVPPSSTPFWSVLSPKVLGIAIARYDFCARDMRELSLLKGDVVKIYTKMSANGWWRGEVNGRVGWFPSTYVEEDE